MLFEVYTILAFALLGHIKLFLLSLLFNVSSSIFIQRMFFKHNSSLISNYNITLLKERGVGNMFFPAVAVQSCILLG